MLSLTLKYTFWRSTPGFSNEMPPTFATEQYGAALRKAGVVTPGTQALSAVDTELNVNYACRSPLPSVGSTVFFSS